MNKVKLEDFDLEHIQYLQQLVNYYGYSCLTEDDQYLLEQWKNNVKK